MQNSIGDICSPAVHYVRTQISQDTCNFFTVSTVLTPALNLLMFLPEEPTTQVSSGPHLLVQCSASLIPFFLYLLRVALLTSTSCTALAGLPDNRSRPHALQELPPSLSQMLQLLLKHLQHLCSVHLHLVQHSTAQPAVLRDLHTPLMEKSGLCSSIRDRWHSSHHQSSLILHIDPQNFFCPEFHWTALRSSSSELLAHLSLWMTAVLT